MTRKRSEVRVLYGPLTSVGRFRVQYLLRDEIGVPIAGCKRAEDDQLVDREGAEHLLPDQRSASVVRETGSASTQVL